MNDRPYNGPDRRKPPERSKLHWDGTITAGNLLTAVAMLVAMLVWGLRLEGRVDLQQTVAALHTARILTLETKDQADTREIAAVRESLAKLTAQSEATLRAVTRLETSIDQNSRHP